jgi:osmotically-inducible protein OsmY
MRCGNRKQVELLQPHVTQSGDRQMESVVRADLRQFSRHEMARVACTINERVLTLTGRVSSYYLKQMAQRIAFERLSNTVQIVNEIQVEQ